MINLKLLETVKESLSNFDGENSSDLIKAEKILKAQQKIDSEISLNDIEKFITFFKENGNKYNLLFQDENLSKIYRNEYFKINSSHNRIFQNIMEITPDFRNFSSEYIKNYIQTNIQNNDWENLRIFYKNYFPVIDPLVKEYLIDQLVQKNRLVRSIIPFPDNYKYLLIQYKHGIDQHFYALQSDIDSSYFNEEILDINNDISEHQNIEPFPKAFLGRVLVALGHFDAYTEELKRILKKNSRIGADWVIKGSPFFPKDLEEEIKQVNQQVQQSIIDFRLKIAKRKSNPLAWVAIIIAYYGLPLALFGFLLKINIYIFIVVFIVETIVFLIAHKKMERRYNQKFGESYNDSLEKVKKFGYKLMRVQLYTFIVWFLIAILVGVIVAWTTKPILGLLLTIALPFVIRKELKKYK